MTEKEYNLLLEEIENADFSRFEKLDESKQIKIMETWNEKQWIKYRMQNTISEEECFSPVLKHIQEDDD